MMIGKITAAALIAAASTWVMPAIAQKSAYTLEMIAWHNTPEDCWIAVDDSVYVITDYLPEHNGTPENLSALCGSDATGVFKELGRKGRGTLRDIAPYRIAAFERSGS